jgi:hypothetical protein
MSTENITGINKYPYKKINHFEEYLNMHFPNETTVTIDEKIVEYFKKWNYDLHKNNIVRVSKTINKF